VFFLVLSACSSAILKTTRRRLLLARRRKKRFSFVTFLLVTLRRTMASTNGKVEKTLYSGRAAFGMLGVEGGGSRGSSRLCRHFGGDLVCFYRCSRRAERTFASLLLCCSLLFSGYHCKPFAAYGVALQAAAAQNHRRGSGIARRCSGCCQAPGKVRAATYAALRARLRALRVLLFTDARGVARGAFVTRGRADGGGEERGAVITGGDLLWGLERNAMLNISVLTLRKHRVALFSPGKKHPGGLATSPLACIHSLLLCMYAAFLYHRSGAGRRASSLNRNASGAAPLLKRGLSAVATLFTSL